MRVRTTSTRRSNFPSAFLSSALLALVACSDDKPAGDEKWIEVPLVKIFPAEARAVNETVQQKLIFWRYWFFPFTPKGKVCAIEGEVALRLGGPYGHKWRFDAQGRLTQHRWEHPGYNDTHMFRYQDGRVYERVTSFIKLTARYDPDAYMVYEFSGGQMANWGFDAKDIPAARERASAKSGLTEFKSNKIVGLKYGGSTTLRTRGDVRLDKEGYVLQYLKRVYDWNKAKTQYSYVTGDGQERVELKDFDAQGNPQMLVETTTYTDSSRPLVQRTSFQYTYCE